MSKRPRHATCTACSAEGPPRGREASRAGWTSKPYNSGGPPAWLCPEHSPKPAAPVERADSRDFLSRGDSTASLFSSDFLLAALLCSPSSILRRAQREARQAVEAAERALSEDS